MVREHYMLLAVLSWSFRMPCVCGFSDISVGARARVEAGVCKRHMPFCIFHVIM